MSLYQPLHSDLEGSFCMSLPAVLTHRALALTAALGQSGFAPWEVHSMNMLHVFQRHGHSLHGTRPNKNKRA